MQALDVIKCDVDSREQEEMITTPSTSRQPRKLVDRLDVMYKYLDKKDLGELSYDDRSLEKDLEFLYDLLVRPIAYHIGKMKEDHLLILSPNEVCNFPQTL